MAIQDKFNKPNVIYKITKDINLEGGTLTIPAGCTLDFQGGSFSNGTIIGTSTRILNKLQKIFSTTITMAGIWSNLEVYPEWFGAKGDGVTDDTAAFVAINNINIGVEPFSPKLGDIKLSNNTYVLKSVISLKYNIIGCAESKLIFDGGYFKYSYARGLDDLITFYSIKFSATENSSRIFDGNPVHYVMNKCVFENCYDIFNQIDGEDVWTGNLNFNDCIFRDITNIVISAQYYLNRIGFNNCTFRRVNYILDGSFTCGVEFNNCDIEGIHLWKRMGMNRGINFIGCYIEGVYTADSDDALIKPTDTTYGIVTFENCYINTDGNYIYYEKDDLTVEYSSQRGIIKFVDCTLYRADDSYQLFRVGNKPSCFIHIEGIKALIGKWNHTYSGITMYTDVSDIINNTAQIIINIKQYQYRTGKYVNTTPLLSGTTSERPKGTGAPNLEGVLDTIACIGFAFFDTTLGKPVYAKAIAADGTVTWVDAAGATV